MMLYLCNYWEGLKFSGLKDMPRVAVNAITEVFTRLSPKLLFRVF